MAYIPSDDAEANGAGINSPGSSLLQPGAIGAAPSTTNSGPGGGTQATQSNVTPEQKTARSGSSGTFVNLDRYLDANQQGAANLGNTIAGQVTNTGNTAQSALNTGVNTFNNEVKNNSANYTKSLSKAILADPNAAAQNQKYVNAVQGNYTGPTDFTSSDVYSPISNAFNAFQQTATNAGSNAGRKQLISGLQTQTKQYTPGAVGFDNALVSGSQPAQQAIQGAIQSTSALPNALTNQIAMAAKTVQNAQKATAATGQKLQTDIGNSSQSLLDQLGKTAQTATQQAAANNKAALDAFNQGSALSSAQLKLLGISANQYKNILGQRSQITSLGGKGPDISQFEQLGSIPAATISQVATPQDIARYNALNQLLGKTDYTLTPDDKYNGDALSINLSKIIGVNNSAITQAKQAQAAAQAKAAADAQAAADAKAKADALANAQAAANNAPTNSTSPIQQIGQNLGDAINTGLGILSNPAPAVTNIVQQAANTVSNAGNSIKKKLFG